MAKKKQNKKRVKFKSYDKAYTSLYDKIRYRKNKVAALTDEIKKKGNKAKRTILYKEITALNKKLNAYSKKQGYSIRKKPKKPKIEERKFDRKEKTVTYTAKVWDFEATLSKYIQNKTFKKIYIVNEGKNYYVNTARPSTILYGYDQARNSAYGFIGASTPFVDVIEDYANSTLTIHVIS